MKNKHDYNLLVLMFAGMLFLIGLFMMCSCSTVIPIAKSDTVIRTKVVERVRDSMIRIPADSSVMTALIECRDGQARLMQIMAYRPGTKVEPARVTLNNGILTAKCIVDSAKVYWAWKERDTVQTTKVETVKIVQVNYLTSWQWFQVWLGRIFAGLFILAVGFFALKTYLKF